MNKPLFQKLEVQQIQQHSTEIQNTIINNYKALITSASEDKSKSTIQQYFKAGKLFIFYIEQNGFNFHTLELFKNELKNVEHLTASTKNGYLASAKLILKGASKMGVIPAEIATVTNFKVNKEHKKDGLTKSDVLSIQKHINQITKEERKLKLKAMLNLLAFHGLRSQEVATLQVKDIDFNDRQIWVKGKGQDDKEPLPFLNHHTQKTLMKWIYFRGFQHKPNAYIFSSRTDKNGSKPCNTSYIREVFTAKANPDAKKKKQIGIFQKLGIEGRSVHSFRHFFITYLLNCGYTLDEVRQFSRHKTYETVKVYDDRRLKRQLADGIKDEFSFFGE